MNKTNLIAIAAMLLGTVATQRSASAELPGPDKPMMKLDKGVVDLTSPDTNRLDAALPDLAQSFDQGAPQKDLLPAPESTGTPDLPAPAKDLGAPVQDDSDDGCALGGSTGSASPGLLAACLLLGWLRRRTRTSNK